MTRDSARRAPAGLARWMDDYVDGDPRAFRRLHQALEPRLRAFVASLLRDDPCLDDVVQLTFLKAHVARERFTADGPDPDGAVQAWYFTIARHAALDHLRGRKRQAIRVATADVEQARAAPSAAPPAAAYDPEAAKIERETSLQRASSVRAAIAALPPGQRQVVQMHKIEGLSMKEIAERLGIREGAVRVRAHRAYRALARLLGGPA